MVEAKRPSILKISIKQLSLLLLLVAVITSVDKTVAISVAIGGLLAIIPHLYFTIFAFRYWGARASSSIARSFYRGETGKFVLTLVGFATIFLLYPTVSIMGLMIGYIVMVIVQIWLVAKSVKNI